MIPFSSANRAELNGIIQERLREQPTAHWVAVLNQAGIPAGPVNRIDEAFSDPQVLALAMVEPVDHATLGRLGLIRNAVTMTRTPGRVRVPSPEPGEHTAEVLAELGVDGGELAALRRRGVV
jgi:formyl-CoA transferase